MNEPVIQVLLPILCALFTVALLSLSLKKIESKQEGVTPPEQPVYLVVKGPNQTIAYRVTDNL